MAQVTSPPDRSGRLAHAGVVKHPVRQRLPSEAGIHMMQLPFSPGVRRLDLRSSRPPLFELFAVLAVVAAGCSDGSDRVLSVEPQSTVAARVATQGDLLSGPLARGVAGDFVLENEHLRVIIQKPGRQWLSIGTFGGNIIDVTRKDETGAMLPDHQQAPV